MRFECGVENENAGRPLKLELQKTKGFFFFLSTFHTTFETLLLKKYVARLKFEYVWVVVFGVVTEA